MANLKGSTFEKQINDAIHRLEARGESRHGRDDNKTHSHAVSAKREMYLNDFKKFAESQNLGGKLNTHFDKVDSFLEKRLENLSAKTANDYAAGFNSMLKGLENTRVPIPSTAYSAIDSARNDLKSDLRAERKEYSTSRAIDDKVAYTAKLERPGTALVAELQLEAGFRASEALEIAKNPQNYIQNNEISGVSGKGGQIYPTKEISRDLAERLVNNEAQIPSYSTYQADIKETGHTSHDLRITYAVVEYNENIEKGLDHNEALKETSEQLNHHREDITTYYLKRA